LVVDALECSLFETTAAEIHIGFGYVYSAGKIQGLADEWSLIITGGGPADQNEFVEALGAGNNRRSEKRPPVANDFALGYTYLDVLDADQEGEPSWAPQAQQCRRIVG